MPSVDAPRLARVTCNLADELLHWMSAYNPQRRKAKAAPIDSRDESKLKTLRRRAADVLCNSNKPAVAVRGMSQSGKSLFLSSGVLRPEDPDFSPLGRSDELGPPAYLPQLSFDDDINPQSGAYEATAVVTRFTTAHQNDEPAFQSHPVMARTMSRLEWLCVVSRGFHTSCEVQSQEVWRNDDLQSLFRDGGQRATGGELDDDWRSDLLETYTYMQNLDPVRFSADEAVLAGLLDSHPLHDEGYGEIAAYLFWDGWPELTQLFRSVCRFLERLQSDGREGLLCHWAAVRFLLDSARPDRQGSPCSQCWPTVSWSDIVDRRVDGWYVLDYQPGAGPPQEKLSDIQAAILELVLPVLPHRLNNDWRQVLEQRDVLDIPGPKSTFNFEHKCLRAESLDEQMSIIKHGKVDYLVDEYLQQQRIDVLLVMLRGGNLDEGLKEYIDSWGRARYGNKAWTKCLGDDPTALYLVMTGIDDEFRDRPVNSLLYDNRLLVARSILREIMTDFRDAGRAFTNIFPIRFPGTWDVDSERRELFGAERWDHATEVFLGSDLVRIHVADAEKKWQAAQDDLDGGAGLIANAICRGAEGDREHIAQQRVIETIHSQLIQLAESWVVEPAMAQARDAGGIPPGNTELAKLVVSALLVSAGAKVAPRTDRAGEH